jgi:mono/diheme cytochrome c family protein
VAGVRWLAAAAAVVTLVVCALIVHSLVVSASPSTPRDVAAGREAYVLYCAACHGEEGRGDGPAAAGLASRPTNFTDGRLMNRVPDDFLANVIVSGAAAEGLAPTMPAFGRLLSDTQVRQLVAFIRSLAEPAFEPGMARPIVSVPGAPVQPIFFSHLIHAGKYQVGCEYCHADARRSQFAGLPSVQRCMGCHRIIGAQDNPEIQKIHGYWDRAEPIPWVRVFKVPEFVYFTHKPHVEAGVTCQTCHGPIEQMRVVGVRAGRTLANDLLNLVGFRPPSPPLTMGWCIECHRAENETRGTQAPFDCMACHH